MPRYIDADKLIDTLQNLAYDDWNQGVTTSWATAYSECEELVDSVPTEDVEPVKRGRWIKLEDDYNDHLYECSYCHTWTSLPTEEVNYGSIRYCWSCGAKMDEVEDAE